MQTPSTRELLIVGLTAAAIALGSVVAGALLSSVATAAPAPPAAPATLAATGFGTGLPFAPQYPLWTDGATKARWIQLPAGGQIDATDADAWQFPVGTKLWKQFAYDGVLVETRYMERTPAGWQYASYDAAGVLVDGKRARTLSNGHVIPSELECRGCHANGATPVLGFAALQLSPDRDPLAPHTTFSPLDMRTLLATGLLRHYAGPTAPRIAGTPTQRAALGYLHGNCSGCHRADGMMANVGMDLRQLVDAPSPALSTTINAPSHFKTAGLTTRIVAGDPDHSVLVARISSRDPVVQMPPLGTSVVDEAAVSLVTRFVRELPASVATNH